MTCKVLCQGTYFAPNTLNSITTLRRTHRARYALNNLLTSSLNLFINLLKPLSLRRTHPARVRHDDRDRTDGHDEEEDVVEDDGGVLTSYKKRMKEV